MKLTSTAFLEEIPTGENGSKKKKKRKEFGSSCRNTLVDGGCSHVRQAAEAGCTSLNASVNAVRGGDKKGNDPPAKQVRGVLITLALVSAGWLEMIRFPELMLILEDRLAVTRVWHNQCKWSAALASQAALLRGSSLIKGFLSPVEFCLRRDSPTERAQSFSPLTFKDTDITEAGQEWKKDAKTRRTSPPDWEGEVP